jgi:hypothetical protein
LKIKVDCQSPILQIILEKKFSKNLSVSEEAVLLTDIEGIDNSVYIQPNFPLNFSLLEDEVQKTSKEDIPKSDIEIDTIRDKIVEIGYKHYLEFKESLSKELEIIIKTTDK